MSFFGRLRAGLRRTAEQLGERVDEIISRSGGSEGSLPPNDETFDALEALLLQADVGVMATNRIILGIREREAVGNESSLRERLRQEIIQILSIPTPAPINGTRPKVILVVGVNGTGKTTTVGKACSPHAGRGTQSPDLCRRYVPGGSRRAARGMGRARGRGYSDGARWRRPGGGGV